MHNTYKISLGESKRKGCFWKFGSGREKGIKMDLRTMCESVDWINVAQDTVLGSNGGYCVRGKDALYSQKVGSFYTNWTIISFLRIYLPRNISESGLRTD
jgi:hypothetical protein